MYQVLYRKYRPKVFSDVYGQEHVTKTLLNEIKENRVSHAYLFTGSRGTGKTTCAKILAKAVNCENSNDGEPCGECEVCRGIDSGSLFDVVEIDAASNNSVNDIRDLREEVNYTPTRCKYRVYIIDEVHMLSPGAFNALLKTLEEPPAHVIFILATTEVHKLPATILSRCQRFDFKRIKPEVMSLRLKEVAEKESISIDDDAAMLIARIADGGLRDGLSILDQCAGKSKKITADIVSDAAGLAGREALYDLSDAVFSKSSAKALDTIASLYNGSYDMERLCSEMISHFRNFLIVKTVKNSRELIVCTDDEFDTIKDYASKFTLESIIYSLDLMQNTLAVIKSGANARIEMEMTFVKLCNPLLESSNESLLERISALELAVKTGNIGFKNSNSVSETAKVEPQKYLPSSSNISENKTEKFEEKTADDGGLGYASKVADSEYKNDTHDNNTANVALQTEKKAESVASQQKSTAEYSDVQMLFPRWDELLDAVFKTDKALYSLLANSKGYIQSEFFLIDSPNESFSKFIKTENHLRNLRQAIFNITGQSYKVGFFKNSEPEKQKKDPLDSLIDKANGKIELNVE